MDAVGHENRQKVMYITLPARNSTRPTENLVKDERCLFSVCETQYAFFETSMQNHIFCFVVFIFYEILGVCCWSICY